MIHLNSKRTKVDECAQIKDLHQKHENYIERAMDLAAKSDMMNHRHGCIIVSNRGKILAEGYNHYWGPFMSIHAEVDALSKIHKNQKKNISQCTMYVVRIGTDKMGTPLKYSRPCEKCTEAILKSGIRKVYYSTSLNFLMCSEMVQFTKTAHRDRTIKKGESCCRENDVNVHLHFHFNHQDQIHRHQNP